MQIKSSNKEEKSVLEEPATAQTQPQPQQQTQESLQIINTQQYLDKLKLELSKDLQ
jgi:hypothetical protein